MFFLLNTAAKSLQSCPTLCDPIDGSPPGSAVPGILQARTLEWVAISFSNAWSEKWKEVAQSCPTLSDPMDCSLPGSSVRGIFQARVLEWGATAFSILAIVKSAFSYFYLSNLGCFHLSAGLPPCTKVLFHSQLLNVTPPEIKDNFIQNYLCQVYLRDSRLLLLCLPQFLDITIISPNTLYLGCLTQQPQPWVVTQH